MYMKEQRGDESVEQSVCLSESQCPRLEKEGFGLDSGHGPRDPNVAPLYYENVEEKVISGINL